MEESVVEAMARVHSNSTANATVVRWFIHGFSPPDAQVFRLVIHRELTGLSTAGTGVFHGPSTMFSTACEAGAPSEIADCAARWAPGRHQSHQTEHHDRDPQNINEQIVEHDISPASNDR
jgi:hypothetical protein